MTNKYIKIVMTSTKHGVGGSFNIEACFKLDNIPVPFKDIPVKIDTGCSISTIPARKLKLSENIRNTLKRNDINNNINYYLSYGVETGGEKHEEPKTPDEKMLCPAIKFEHTITNFKIAGVDINTSKICLNYNRNGNILIGMDILKDWDIHINTIDTGETIFLACPKCMINDEYLYELEKTFHIGTEVYSAIARESIN